MSRKRFIIIISSLLLLLLAHGVALIYRVQPGVSLWFPPSGVAIALTLWFGPIGVILTGIASVLMAPFWGLNGSMRLVGLMDMIEPLAAWWLFCRCFKGSIGFKNLRDAIGFIISAPGIACGISAITGSFTLLLLNKLSIDSLGETIANWWLGNGMGAIAIAPTILLIFTPLLQNWLPLTWKNQPVWESVPEPVFNGFNRWQWQELGLILTISFFIANFTVQLSHRSSFSLQQFAFLSFIPIIWAAFRMGTTAGMLSATFIVVVTLLNYLLLYPTALLLPFFPVEANLLYIHKLSLLVQCAVGLLIGTAISEQANIQANLAIEKQKRIEYQTRAQLSDNLFQVNRLLTEANRKLQKNEAELYSRQQEFEALVENSPDIVSRFDRQLRHVYVNKSLEKATGIAVKDYIGKTVAELGIPEKNYQQWQSKLQTTLESGKEQTDEFSFLSPDGILHFYQARLVPEFAEDGLVNSILVVTRDITKLKEIEKQLQEKQHFIEQITDTVPGIIYVYDLIEQRNIYANRQVAENLGYTPAAIQEMRENLFTQLMHPEDLARLPAALERINSLEDGQINEFEFRMRHANGQWHWFSDRSTVFRRTPQGLPSQVLGVAQDISERKEVEIALKKANERFNFVITAVNSMIYDWDMQANYVERTPALKQLLGYSPEEVDPSSEWWWQQIHPEDRQRLPTTTETTQTVNDCYTLEYRVRNKQGKYIYVQDQGIILRNSTGDAVRAVGSTTDISPRKQAQEALRESEERYRLLTQAVPTILFTNHADGWCDYISQQFYDYTGMPPGSGVGLDWTSVLHPGDRERSIALWRKCVEQGKPFQTEYRFRGADGEYRWFIARSSPIYDNQGNITKWFGVCNDIHELKETQEALQRSEARARRLVDSNLIGVLFTDFEGNILDANDAFLQIVGYQREEISYLNWREITPIEYAYLDEQAITKVRSQGSCTPYEKEYLRKNGSRVPILLGIARLLESERECVCFVLDLSERKRAETQNQQLAALVENCSDFIGLANLNGRPIFLNRAGQELVGLNPASFAQTEHILEYFAAEDAAYVRNTILPSLNTQGFWQGEFRFRHFLSGELLPVFYNIFTIREPKTGQPLAYATVTREISQQKRIEAQRIELLEREQTARQQAEAANRMKDEFLAIVSHELRSPLNAILGWSRLLRTQKMDAATIEKALEIIERNAQAQTQLIEDLLDISRIIRGKIKLYLRPIQLSRVVEAALDTVSPTASTKQIQLDSSLDSSLMVSGDFDRLVQIMWNLLSNGIKFTPPGGRVKVLLEVIEHHYEGVESLLAQIQVIDTGKGIHADFLPYVFDVFQQADGTTSRSHGGLGLGLAIVRHLVELHGGRVSADSLGEGQGSTFTVQLPLLSSKIELIAAQDPSLVTVDRSLINGLKILVVDDELYSREFLVTALNYYGAKVTAAASAQEALQLLKQEKPDILLSDIGMPVEDGYTLIRKVRALSEQQGGTIPAAALTAYVREEDRYQALSAGFQMHIPKPIDPMQLINVIAQLAKQK